MGALVQTLPHHHRLRPAKEGSAPSSPVPGFLTGPCFDASAAFAHAPARRVARLSTRPTPFGAAETFTPELSSPQVTPRRSRVSLRSCLDSCCDGTCIRWESAVMGCNFAPRALPRFTATADPSATLSPSAHFPGALVIGRIQSRRFRGGARRASPVARRVLVTVPPLPPRRRGHVAPTSVRRSLLPSRSSQPLGLRGFQFRGYLCVHSHCGPGTRSPSSRELRRWAPEHRFPFTLPSKLRGCWLLPRRDCPPLNTSALLWTHGSSRSWASRFPRQQCPSTSSAIGSRHRRPGEPFSRTTFRPSSPSTSSSSPP